MATRFADHLLEGDHASRPSAGDVPAGTLYSCSDHDIIYQSDGDSTWSDWATLGGTGGGGLFDAYALIRDEKTANTDGGTFNSGAWRTRDLNTESFDPSGIVSISSNQFTLEAGTYFIRARAPAYRVDRHKLQIYNITDSAAAIIGASCYANSDDPHWSHAHLEGRITIAGTKAFELQHRCQTDSAAGSQGFGNPSNFSVVEVYAEVEIWREA